MFRAVSLFYFVTMNDTSKADGLNELVLSSKVVARKSPAAPLKLTLIIQLFEFES